VAGRHELCKNRQQVRRCLAGARLGAADDVVTLERVGNTALWIGVVWVKPRCESASSTWGSVIKSTNGTGAGSNGTDSRVVEAA